MQESLETKLHNFLKAQGGKRIPYEQIKYLVENVWKTPKNGHYRMETLTRRWRHDRYRENDISDRIGKETSGGAITHLYYKMDSETQNSAPQTTLKPHLYRAIDKSWTFAHKGVISDGYKSKNEAKMAAENYCCGNKIKGLSEHSDDCKFMMEFCKEKEEKTIKQPTLL